MRQMQITLFDYLWAVGSLLAFIVALRLWWAIGAGRGDSPRPPMVVPPAIAQVQ